MPDCQLSLSFQSVSSSPLSFIFSFTPLNNLLSPSRFPLHDLLRYSQICLSLFMSKLYHLFFFDVLYYFVSNIHNLPYPLICHSFHSRIFCCSFPIIHFSSLYHFCSSYFSELYIIILFTLQLYILMLFVSFILLPHSISSSDDTAFVPRVFRSLIACSRYPFYDNFIPRYL